MSSLIVILGLLLLVLATVGTGFLEDWLSFDQDTMDSVLVGAGAILILLLIYWAAKKGSGAAAG